MVVQPIQNITNPQPAPIFDEYKAQKNAESQALINSFKTPEGLGENVGSLLVNAAMFGGLGKLGKVAKVEAPKIKVPKTAFDAMKKIRKQPVEIPKTSYEEMLGLEPQIVNKPIGETVGEQGQKVLTGGLEAQPNYFDHQNFSINPDTSIDENAKNIRNIHSSRVPLKTQAEISTF